MYSVMRILWGNKRLQFWTSNPDKDTLFLHDVSSNVCTLLCEYCETTKVLTNKRSTQV
jgi:hypothetical protein